MRIHLLVALLLAGCSSHASKQDQLNAAANESTPAATDVLAGAAQNGKNEAAALNGAASAQGANASATNIHRKEARLKSANGPSPSQPVEPSQDEPGNSNSD